jgi:hypothetical protein
MGTLELQRNWQHAKNINLGCDQQSCGGRTSQDPQSTFQCTQDTSLEVKNLLSALLGFGLPGYLCPLSFFFYLRMSILSLSYYGILGACVMADLLGQLA